MSINIKNLLLNENSFGLGKKQIISNHLYSHMHSRRTTVAHTQVYAGLDTYLYQSKFKTFCKKFMSINIKNLLLNEKFWARKETDNIQPLVQSHAFETHNCSTYTSVCWSRHISVYSKSKISFVKTVTV